MPTKFDVIVIGAGLGGLSSATALAQKGASVCLLERHNVPGGYATSFVRGRFEFEISLHELSGIDDTEGNSSLLDYLNGLGVGLEVEFLDVPEAYRCVFPTLDVVMPTGWEAYEATLCETFPGEVPGIRTLCQRLRDTAEEVRRYTRSPSKPHPLMAPFHFPNILRILPGSWSQLLAHHVQDKGLRAVLSQYWGYFGKGPSEVSALYFAGALNSYLTKGPKFIKGRSQSLSSAFVKAFEGHGGVAHFNCGAARILTQGDRVTGVVTQEGMELQADYVISNADPITTCRDLIGVDRVPARFFRSLRHRETSASAVNVYLGLSCPPSALGLTAHENFINDSYDLDRHCALTKRLDPPGAILATCYNHVRPDISPPGTSMLVLTALSEGAPWFGVAPQDYLDTKSRFADAMLRLAERIMPDLRRHIEVLEVATPVTNLRYTGASNGSIYGFANSTFDHTVFRLSPRGPLGGLYFAGAWTRPGGGFEPCIESGAATSNLISNQLGLPIGESH